jgi:hypothetical protein
VYIYFDISSVAQFLFQCPVGSFYFFPNFRNDMIQRLVVSIMTRMIRNLWRIDLTVIDI